MNASIENAQEHASLGIPISLLPGGQKGSNSSEWQNTATTDLCEIVRRAEANSNLTNYALVAKAESGGFLFLDDDGGIRNAFEAAGGKMLPTRKNRSCSGNFHYIYRHSKKSLDFQKRINKAYISAPNPDGDGEMWSLRMHNAYILGPGSVAKNHDGELAEYKTTHRLDIIEIPADMLDFLIKNYNSSRQIQKPAVGNQEYHVPVYTPEMIEGFIVNH
ncbi:MAG: bifunctional DNA primase/polymerase, partial [Candidatus Acidiferrales bacterium]